MVGSDQQSEFRAFIWSLARDAGPTVLRYFRAALEVANKTPQGNFDPVTIADREVEQQMRAAITARYPEHGIVGEEFGTVLGTSEFRWILDPIDGTRAFVSGLPTWGTLIGLCENDQAVLGVMSQPFVGEIFIGGYGSTAVCRSGQEHPLSVRTGVALSEAYLFATAPDMFATGFESDAFARLSRAVRLTRFGVDCYAYCLLAAGFIDLVVEAGLEFFDIGPLIPIVEAAGGIVSDWEGGAVRTGGRVIAAASPQLHEQALRYLRDA